MDIKLKIILFFGLLASCSDNQPVKVDSFKDANPTKDAVLHSKIDTVYYTLDSTTFDISSEFAKHIGDTLLLYIYDSLGNIKKTISYPAFRTNTYYSYDENGDLQYKRILSDFLSEFYFSSFIDTNKRIKYTKEPDPLGSTYLSQTYYNENGFPDSLITYTALQRRRIKYKEYFTYENGKLLQSSKQTLKEYIKDAEEGGSILADTITYKYINSKLATITKTEFYPGKMTIKIIDHYDSNERPLYKEFYLTNGYERLKAKINVP
jgi:hypothetical protein